MNNREVLDKLCDMLIHHSLRPINVEAHTDHQAEPVPLECVQPKISRPLHKYVQHACYTTSIIIEINATIIQEI